ncbi:hypothetical protein [Actomonas aquatica]|uniref:Glycosyltransferase RgtA/B/C/D-like domain-containing protein n=1 Tax=Actomonas aquatica TaxID=2866162 RepID=A0ABZ1C7V1_9BACT|nr:hypothetical protein [Opitutus sp. WL0086]WRQ87497.1 hypothetical protein K1X11_022000 [Opitutus sp. WL0086]
MVPEPSPAPSPDSRRLPPFWSWLVLAAILLNTWWVTQNFTAGFLVGHEFRQSQTALSVHHMVQDHDFSLAYPTPLFGPPWSIPFEFPLYQWSVAGLVELTGWSIPVAARTVNVILFPGVLAGLYVLLRQLRAPGIVTGTTLALTATAPLYIFYTRSVLIETMALGFSVWFLVAFIRMCQPETRSFAYAGLTAVLGALAILVKVTTFVPWCAAAALIGLHHTWTAWRAKDLPRVFHLVRLGFVAALLPAVSILWWLSFADAIKAQSPGGQELSSAALSDTNFGTWADRTDPAGWSAVSGHISGSLLPWWLLPLALLAAWRAPSGTRRLLLIPLLLVLGTILLFPVLYQRHDYYFYAIGPFVVVAFAAALDRVSTALPAPLRRGVPALLVVALIAAQTGSYLRLFHPSQTLRSWGGNDLIHVLRDQLPPEGVVVIAGENWNAATPYYMQRRALMLVDEVADDPAARARYFDALGDTSVVALWLSSHQRSNTGLLQDVHERYGIGPNRIASGPITDAYIVPQFSIGVISALLHNPAFDDVTLHAEMPPPPPPEPFVTGSELTAVQPIQADQIFKFITPAPFQYRTQFGFNVVDLPDGTQALGAHPSSELWIQVSPAAATVDYTIGLQPAAYNDPTATETTDGVTFTIVALNDNGAPLAQAEHALRPHQDPDFQNPQQHQLALPAGTRQLVLQTSPGETLTRDWAYWGRVDVRRDDAQASLHDQ